MNVATHVLYIQFPHEEPMRLATGEEHEMIKFGYNCISHMSTEVKVKVFRIDHFPVFI